MADETQDIITSTPSESDQYGGQDSWNPNNEVTNSEERLNNFNPTGGYNYVPRFIRQVSDLNYGEIVTHENYNEKLNLNTIQGDYNTEVMRLLLSSNGSEDSPRIPYLDQLVYDLNIVKVNSSELSRVAYTGSYNDLKDIPNTVMSINGIKPDVETGLVTIVPSDIGAVNKSSYDENKVQTDKDIETISNNIESISNDIATIDSKLDTTNSKLSSVSFKLNTTSNKVSVLTNTLNTTNEELSSLTNEVHNDYATKFNVKEAIDSLGTIQVIKGRVDTKEQLPTDAKPGDVWLVGETTEEDKYEYLMTESGWEILGKTTNVDLSNYYTKTETNNAINEVADTKQNKLTPGDNITIDENNVISFAGESTDYRLLEVGYNGHIDIEKLEQGTYLILLKPNTSFTIDVYIDYTDTDGTKKSKIISINKLGYTIISVTTNFNTSSNTVYAYLSCLNISLGLTGSVTITKKELTFNRNNNATIVTPTIYSSSPITENSKPIISGLYKFSTVPEVDSLSRVVTKDTQFTTKNYVDNTVKVVDDKVNELELFKFPNATIVGTPTIQSGQVSGFTTSDYLEFPFLVDFRNKPFEINFAFTTGTDVDTQQNILDSTFGLAFAIRNKHLVLALSYDGTSWATEQTGSLVLESQTTYRIRISWDGSIYKVEYSLDGGETYSIDINFSSSQQPYPKQIYIGVSNTSNNYFEGSINLNYANVKVQNEIIWTGMDDVGLATRLATDMSNIDQAGIDYINSLINAKITTALEGVY